MQINKTDNYFSDNSLFRIEKQSVVSNVPYYSGNADYSVNGDKRPPFQYDLIALEIKDQNILVMGFPFKYLAREIVNKLIKDKKYLSKGGFVKPNLDKLLKESTVSDFSDDAYSFHFSSLGLTLTGDTNMTSIDFGGDRPLDSPIYKKLFKDVIQKKQAILENCGLKCEINADEEENIPKTRGNVHLDHFGNLKTYIHGSGKNVFVLPYIFSLLKNHKCVDTTLVNPLLHLQDE